MKTFYFRLDGDLVLDVIEYENEGYVTAQFSILPHDVLAGYYRLQNGRLVIDDALKAEITKEPLQEQVDNLAAQVNPKNPDEIFLSLDVANTSLDDLKAKKIDQLNYLCNQSILAGFSSSALGDVHQYPFSEVDQLNYAGTLSLMNADSTLDSISWKTLDIGVQTHSKAQFNTVCKDSFSHKQTKIAQYWQLKESAQNALSKDEVLNINWS